MGPLKLLIVETDTAVLSSFLDALESDAVRDKFRCIRVSNTAHAFREIEKDPPDILVLDLNLEDDPHAEPLTRLKTAGGQFPVLAVLPDDQRRHALLVLEKGADEVLVPSQTTEGNLSVFLKRMAQRFSDRKKLQANERWQRLLIENISDVILVMNDGGLISYAGPSSERVLGLNATDLIGRNILDEIHRDDRAVMADHLEGGFAARGTLATIQIRFRHPSGRWVPLEAHGRVVTDAEEKPVCVLNARDISHHVELAEELRTLSLRDELTGLYNRRAFVGYLEQQLKVDERLKKKGIYLLFIDLDDFKWINDQLGHKMGDAALIEASKILKSTFRDADLVARLGGDEFAVFLTHGVDEEVGVDILKDRLFAGVQAWNQREERPYRLAMSVGVVHHVLAQKMSVTELMKKADDLMYRQKREKKRTAFKPRPPELTSRTE